MSMMDLYTTEQATQALVGAIETKKLLVKEIETLDVMIFILKYYLATGDPLDPVALGIEDFEGDLDD
jgi:hypothetical protein